MNENEIASVVVDAALRIHKELGPGLLESPYKGALGHELRKAGLRTESEVPIDVRWDGMELGLGFRADLVVENLVIVEVKSVEEIRKVHKKQLLTYLRVADKRLGLLINFGGALLKEGICRIVNNLKD